MPNSSKWIDKANLSRFWDSIKHRFTIYEEQTTELMSNEAAFEADVKNRVEANEAAMPSLAATAANNALDEKFGEDIADNVTAWLTEHVDPVGSAVVVDDTLSISGAAADAKVTGDRIGDLKGAINENTGTIPIAMLGTNQYIKTNLAVGSTVSLTPQTSTDFKYAIISCSQGEKFTINATGGQSPRVWCFIDSNNVIISNDPTNNHTVTDLILTAPANSAKLIINDKSGSVSYVGVNRIDTLENDVDTLETNLNKYTGGGYIGLSANTDLNTVTTNGNYYTATSVIASSILNSPISVPFVLNVKDALPNVNTRCVQTLEPCYGQTRNTVRFVRFVNRTTGNTGPWHSFATNDVATELANGLMSLDDKRKLNNIEFEGNLENIFYPSVAAKISELLNIEKTYCILHDNFRRADNASDIGYNGSGTLKMQYTDMASSETETQNIAVGILSNKAVANNPNNVENALRFKIRNLGKLPYKASMSFDGTGVIVISPIDTNNYIYVRCTENGVAVGHVGSVECTDASITHNGGVSSAEIYVYPNKISVFVCGEKLIETDATPVNAYCGIYFSSSEINDIAYTDFNLFSPTKNIPTNIDNAIENCGVPSSSFLGYMSQADSSYGITFNSSVTRYSNKSLRFEQRKADSMGGTYRSEITPPYMRPRNYNLQTKVFSYDMYLPSDYDYDSKPEILWQMHHKPDGINPDAMYPNIAFGTNQDKVRMIIRSFAGKANSADDATSTVFEIGDVDKGAWHHYDVFIREGYEDLHHPCVALFVDGEPKVLTRIPNCYNTTEGSYLKIGMYKSAWTTQTTETTTRTVYYDNLNIWQ